MPLYSINGTIIKTNIKELSLALQDIFELYIDDKKDNVYIETDTFHFYIFDYLYVPLYESGYADYLLNSSFRGEFEDVKAFVRNIVLSLYDSNIISGVEFYEDFQENTGDNFTEYIIKHPEYGDASAITIDLWE